MTRFAYFVSMFIILSCSATAQVVDTLPFFVAARGIYTSYTSLHNNVPDRTDPFHIFERTKGDILFSGGGAYRFELDSAEKSEWRELRKALVGISDGKNFYISDKYTSGGWMGLSKCYLEGPYIYTQTRSSAGNYTEGGLIPGLIPVGYGTIVNIRTREHAPLTDALLKKLLKKYPDLNDLYKDRNPIKHYAIDILERINEKERATIP